MRAAGAVILFSGVLAAWVPATSRADVAPAAVAPRRGYVDLTVVAGSDEAASLTDTLRELLGRLGLGLRVAAPPTSADAAAGAPPVDPSARARVTVDESPADHVDIAVTDLRAGAVPGPARRSLAKGDSTAILTEQIAHVVHSTLESLLATEDAPPPPPPAAGPVAPEHPDDHAVDRTPPDASGEHGVGVGATAFASLRGVASGAGPVVGAGAAVTLTAWRGFGRPTFWLSGSYNAPFGEQTSDVQVQTTLTSLRAGATIALFSAQAFGLEAGLGAGADLFHTVPGNPAPAVSLGPTMDIADPVVTARVSAGVRVAGGARLVVGVDADYDPLAHRYVTVALSGAHEAVFQPWAVRPSVLVGLCVPLAGGMGCAE